MKSLYCFFLVFGMILSCAACTASPESLPSQTTAVSTAAGPVCWEQIVLEDAQAQYIMERTEAFYGEELIMDPMVIRYYGDYQGVMVAFVDSIVFVDGGGIVYGQGTWEQTIGGLCFPYATAQQLFAFQGDEALMLKDAYDAGWLSQASLELLHKNYMEGSYYRYTSPSEIPNPQLSPYMETVLKNVYLTRDSEDPISREDLEVELIWSASGAKYVVFFHCSCQYTQAIETEVIGGLEFIYPSGQRMYVYRDGQLRSFQAAVEEGWFTYGELTWLYADYRQIKAELYE